ncbi:MAG: Ig-like domain-containing protein [bacterium]|nr:Ig-like domain-containing protein [bacterium]
MLMLIFVSLSLSGCSGGGEGDEELENIPAPGLGLADNSEPVLIAPVYPRNNETGVPLNSHVRAVLLSNPDPLTVNSQNIRLAQAVSPVEATVSVIENIIDIHSADALLPNVVYTVIISGVKNFNGKTMPAPLVWTFITGDVLDLIPPSVAAMSPDNGAIAEIDATILATFDEAVDRLTVYSNTFRLIDSDTGEVISGAIGVRDNDKVISLKPSTKLVRGGHYQVLVEGIKDMAGNVSVTPPVWNFSITGPAVTTVNLATADWVSYSKGGSAQAAFNKVDGTIQENIPGNSTDVSVRWAPMVIDKTKIYHVSFSCNFTPGFLTVEVQLKQNGGAYHAYSTVSAACIAGKVAIDLVPDGDDAVGRLNFNFGASAGTYNVGTVKIRY